MMTKANNHHFNGYPFSLSASRAAEHFILHIYKLLVYSIHASVAVVVFFFLPNGLTLNLFVRFVCGFLPLSLCSQTS